MPQVHNLPARIYLGLQRYPDLTDWSLPVKMPRLTERADTRTIEEPYRTGRGRVFRAWPTRWAVVIGRWRKHDFDHEVVALERAAGGRSMYAVPLADIRSWPGVAPVDDEGMFADTDGVVAWVDVQR